MTSVASGALQNNNRLITILQEKFYINSIFNPKKLLVEQPANYKPLETAVLSECFLYLSAAELELLNRKKTQLLYQKGETLFKQGAFAPYILYIIDGLVKVYIETGAEKQIIVNLARTGEFLAFSSVFGNENYSYSATALRSTKVCMIDKDAIRQVLMLNPKFAMQITTRNMVIENRLIEIIKNLSYKQMRGKLASALCYLSSDDFIYEGIFGSLTRQDIADLAGITLESAVKFLKEFERDGILTLEGKDIQIRDKSRLEWLSKTG